MKKTLKICLCVITAVMVLSCNVFATSWAEETPYFTTAIDMFYTENINSIRSTEKLKNCVENAYNIGLFGGAVPFACISTSLGAEYAVKIVCTSPIIDGEATNIEKSREYANVDTENKTITPELGTFITEYYMLNSGDVWGNSQGLANYIELAENERIIMAKNNQGEWYYNENSELFAQYENADETLNPALETINAKYENAMTPPQPPVIQNYILDIPSIITAIPNGAKQIINNTFGFEIFEINVAGLLSVILVVAIVAFVTKWLMSR